VPGAEGDFGVLPQHSLFMSVLRPGVIETYEGAQVSERIFVGGGFAEVNERGCTVLAEEAVPVAEIDLEQARRRLAVAQDDLREATEDAARARLEREIAIAEAQIHAAGG
jgi:F-type H+-transporting ATPase subunit epsilon